ncbi:hypothetical protein [Peribacillus sp. NPDC058075]|uniref:hypothetical protein n=1 Tax=unclassified Peribacillus TaxID=2675266 RepID=UPI0036D88EFF
MEWIYKYFSYTAVIAGLGFLIKYHIQKKIDSYFNAELENHKQELNKKLEDHKKELAVMTEKAKYDLTRKLFDFEAYAIKKHTIYPEIFHQLYNTFGELFLLTNKVSKLVRVDENQLDKVYNFDGLDEVEITQRDEQAFKVSLRKNEINEYFTINQIYLSEEVSASCLNILDEIKMVKSEFESQFKKNIFTPSFFKEKNKNIKKKIKLLNRVIYKELSYSHFEETEEKAKQSS